MSSDPTAPVVCSVCGDVVMRSGRKRPPSLCARHYHRKLRNSPIATMAGSPLPNVRINATVPADVGQRAKQYAQETNVTTSSIVGQALEAWLNRKNA